MQTRLLFIYTESSLHAGTGTGLATVDLPIQRERTTQFPNIQGSGLKGALRSQSAGHSSEINAVFGPDPEANASEHAGAIAVGEARILLFPVRSLVGIFAYTTSPQALARFFRELTRTGITDFPLDIPDVPPNTCLVPTNPAVVAQAKVILEEFSFTAQESSRVVTIADWLAANAFPHTPEYDYWRRKLRSSLVILPDDAFRDFVVNSTEVNTRVRIVPDSKTVQTGALWTQEALPADTLMMSAITVRRLRVSNGAWPDSFQEGSAAEVVDWLVQEQNIPSRIQIGGDETTGSGQVALRWY